MCGIVAVAGSDDAWGAARRGLLGLQHRGQQGAGIVAFGADDAPVVVAAPGLVHDALPVDQAVAASVALGHTRYATTGDPRRIDQPFVGSLAGVPFALAHNGQVSLRRAGRALLARRGATPDVATDSAWLVQLVEAAEGDLAARIACLPQWVDGAYALIAATADELVGARDPHGLRPLFVGRDEVSGALALASEPIPLGGLRESGMRWERALAAGEIVAGTPSRLWRRRTEPAGPDALCLLETVYFAAGQTCFVAGDDVERRRELLGEALAREAPAPADIVVGVPSSGTAAARGYASAARLPLVEGLSRRPGALRSFLAPDGPSRARIARDKLAAHSSLVVGRRVVVVDDSVVRGTTSSAVAVMLREAGAREIHLRLSSPPLRHPCFYGVDMPSPGDLAVPRHGSALAVALGYDSVAFLSIAATRRIAGDAACDACFTGRYPDVDTAERALQYPQ